MERFQLAATHFPRFRDPECLVVIGLKADLSAEGAAALAEENLSRNRLQIVGFDWLANRASTVASNVVRPILTTTSIRVI
jgi:hypothetical protein